MKSNNFITHTLLPSILIIIFYSVLIPVIASSIILPKEVLKTDEKEEIVIAAINYLNDFRKKEFQVSTGNGYNNQPGFVTIDNLIHKGYINNPSIYNNKECNYKLSYIQHETLSGKDQYHLYMFCNDNLETLTLSE